MTTPTPTIAAARIASRLGSSAGSSPNSSQVSGSASVSASAARAAAWVGVKLGAGWYRPEAVLMTNMPAASDSTCGAASGSNPSMPPAVAAKTTIIATTMKPRSDRIPSRVRRCM